MSPKPVRQLINLEGHACGLAGHYRWEKEVLIDYIATRLGCMREDIAEDAKFDGIVAEGHYLEMLAIAKALRKHPGAGMGAKIGLTATFYDLRDFVEWSKEELADYLVHQIVRCRLVSVYESNGANRRFAEEVSGLAYAIYYHGNQDRAEDADADAMFTQRLRDQRRENEAAAEEAAEAERAAQASARAAVPGSAKPAKPARARAAA